MLDKLDDKIYDQKARALLNSAMVEMSSNRYGNALRLLREAAPLFEKSESDAAKGRFHYELASALRNLVAIEHRDDYIDRALVEYSAASYHFEQAGDTVDKAAVENNLGFLFYIKGKFKEAHEHLNRARLLFTSLEDSFHAAQVDETRARVLLAQGRNAEAEKVARSAVRTLEKGDEQSVLAEALRTYGTALARLGHYEEGRLTLERALDVAERAGDTESAGVAAINIIEELGELLTAEEMAGFYAQADQLLADSQQQETLARLRSCVRRGGIHKVCRVPVL